MNRRLVYRVGQSGITIVSVFVFTFVLIRQMPGGPLSYLRGQLAAQGYSAEQINELAEVYLRIDPTQPLEVQLYDYVVGILNGNLGRSTWYDEPVAGILAEALPWTVFLMGTAMLLTFAIGITLGAVMAYYEGSSFDVGSTLTSVVLTSIPYYVVGLLMLAFLAYQNSYFPTGGRVGSTVEAGLTPAFVGSVLHHAALPIFSLVITGFGGWALNMRGNSIRVLGSDYIRVARLRGLKSRRITLEYVGRNAILPMYTFLLISIGTVFGGAVILETIFRYPGLGYYILEAVSARDYPLLMGGFNLITVAVVLGVLFADLTYSRIDPRAGGEGNESY